MEPVSIKLYHGGDFVTKRWKTTYEGGGLSLHVNEDEICYFEIVGWIKDLGYKDVGRIWFRRHKCSLFEGRKEIKDDKDIAEFLAAPEKDGYYHIYVVHKEQVGSSSLQITRGELSGKDSHIKKGASADDSASTIRDPPIESHYGLGLYAQNVDHTNVQPQKKPTLLPKPNPRKLNTSVVKMIAKQKEYVRKCDVNQADVWEFEVDYENETYVVNLLQKKCGCYRWELLGIPCCHALACIEKKRLNYEDYVHVAYHVQSYAATYALAFHPMPGQSQWEKTDLAEPMPPTIRVMPGRPKQKKKIKELEEGKVAGEKKQNKCSNCGGIGHNKKKCKKPPQPTAPKSKGGKPKSIDPVVQNIEKKKKRKRKGTGDQVQTSTLQPPQQSQPSQSSCISTVVPDFASQT